MSIMPVQSVNLNGKSVNFQGRNEEEEIPVQSNHSNRVPLKAVPVIALIAMSPMANVPKGYATEPKTNTIEMISPRTEEVQQSKFIPLPANFKIMKRVTIPDSEGYVIDLNLISTDDDNSNYEEVEYKERAISSGNILQRGMVKAVTFIDNETPKQVHIEGIGLDLHNLNNYAPTLAPLGFYTPSPAAISIFKQMVRLKCDNAVYECPININYKGGGYYKEALQAYKKAVGISNY